MTKNPVGLKKLWMLSLAALLSTGAPGKSEPAPQRSVIFPSGSMGSILTREGYAYVINAWTRGHGVLVFDVRDPATPRFIMGLPASGYLRTSAFHKDMLYIPATPFSLMVVDVSEPAQARMIRNMSFNFPIREGDVRCITVDGNRLYIGGEGGGLRVLDISEPGAPMITAHYPEFGRITQIAADGDRLVLRPQRGDVILATHKDDKLTEHARFKAGNIRLIGPAIYETTRRELVIHDISDMSKPGIAAKIAGLSPVGMLSENRMLMQGPDDNLTVFDVSNPLEPEKIRDIAIPEGLELSIASIENGLLYVVDTVMFNLRIFDISGDTARQKGETFIMRSAGNMALGENGHAFLSYSHGVNTRVLTVSPDSRGPADFAAHHMQEVASASDIYTLHDTHRAAAVKRIGSHLLTGDGVLDISNPLKPETVRPVTRVASGIAVRDGLAALAQGDRITLMDVSELPDCAVLGTYEPEDGDNHLADVILGSDLAYVVNRAKERPRIDILDIKDPSNPKLIGECETPPAITAALNDNLLYVPAARGGGITVVDVSNPKSPRLLKTLDGLLASSCYRIAVHDGRLYISDSMHGIRTADIGDPLNPVLIRTYKGDTENTAQYTDFEIKDGKLYGLRFSRLDVWDLD